MDGGLWMFLAIAFGAAAASPLGGIIAILVRPSSLLLSLSVGFAGGVLLGAATFEMVPKALELSSLAATIVAFVIGVAAVWGFDLYVNRGAMAGDKAEERQEVRRHHRRHRPKGGKVTVIAGATAAEELIEGVVVGVSGVIGGGTGLAVGFAIAIDNISEAMSIGELVRDEQGDGGKPAKPILFWTGLIGAALLVSSLGGYFLLGGIPPWWQGVLTAIGAGAMFYIATTGLVPEAESHQYQQSGGLATAAGLLVMLAVTKLG